MQEGPHRFYDRRSSLHQTTIAWRRPSIFGEIIYAMSKMDNYDIVKQMGSVVIME